ncbi:polysaccharide biosynthesis/export family protein [Acinetobacter lanii]|uniref:Polysialic acid transporter n=1 Tax=Acinetobacter lanii TaxID=2715163 RepID=A0A6G8S7S1_9GAMM|nr:polysaccharide biosynthesis/export family protein [Acinetobacter lanii]QIO10174.1 polysialic acid transporter [Acinetobacter lanii]
MKKLILVSSLSLLSASTTFATSLESMVVPQELMGTSSSNAMLQQASAGEEKVLNSQSIVDLSPSSSMKYQTKNRMFGAQLFKGAFASTAGSTFNNSYVINPGDNINLRLWGAYQFTGTQTVDPQGNIFIPNIGPLKVAGISNGSLQSVVTAAVRKIYVSNVNVYAALEQAQPVKVLVTGFVNQPGNYGGVANDTVLAYLDRAGGVDPERGSYVDVQIIRNGQHIKYVNLYDFLLAGQIKPFSFKDGDVIVVAPRKHTFSVEGEVYNAYDFEFNNPTLSVAQALTVARVKPSATHVSVSRRQGTQYTSEYHTLADAQNVMLQDGDLLAVTADRFAGTIQVRIEGAHNGTHALVLPYGSKLSEVMKQLQPNALAEVQSLQLYRPSVAKRQKEMLNVSLDKLEEATLSVRSSTQEEANLRAKDAELVKQFIAKARQVEPKGQVVLDPKHFDDVILEQGDILMIPERTSVIMVHGEVTFPNGVAWREGMKAEDYIGDVGGFTQKSNRSKLIVIHQNGESELVKGSHIIQQGDEILVLPKLQTKGVELTRGLTQILYQIAIAAKIVFNF